MDYSNKYKYASALWKIGLTFFLISILFLTPLIEIESTGHVDRDPFVLTYSYMFFEGGFRSIINTDYFAIQYIFAAASLLALFAVYFSKITVEMLSAGSSTYHHVSKAKSCV